VVAFLHRFLVDDLGELLEVGEAARVVTHDT
jgi:hypothetical protein